MQYHVLLVFTPSCFHVSVVNSQHAEIVSVVFAISAEASSPGQLRLLQQPACKVNTRLIHNTNIATINS